MKSAFVIVYYDSHNDELEVLRLEDSELLTSALEDISLNHGDTLDAKNIIVLKNVEEILEVEKRMKFHFKKFTTD